MAQGTLQKRRQKHCKSQRLKEFVVRLYCSEQLIKKKRGHVFEREQGEYMGDLGGRKWKGEMMWLYCNLKSKGKNIYKELSRKRNGRSGDNKAYWFNKQKKDHTVPTLRSQ